MESHDLLEVLGETDLFDLLPADSLSQIHRIAEQTDLAGLAELSSGMDRVLDALVTERAGVRETMEIMSRLNDRIAARVIELCQARLEAEGHGPPPVTYCWINMGSAARYEQTLRTDQDNAIVYADPLDGQADAVSDYFQRLADAVVDGLEACGFARCSGGVMASNPDWCRPITFWQKTVRQWMGSVETADIRRLTIFLDYRPVFGDARLAERLGHTAVEAFSHSLNAGHLLACDDRKLTAPVGFLGKINTEKSGPHKGHINLKTAALVHLINGCRLLAVQAGITTPSTLKRLDQLASGGHLDHEELEFYRAGFETVMMFKIRENLRKIRAGLTPDNTIDPKALARSERLLLKDALLAVSQLQKRIERDFKVPWMSFFGH